MKSALLKIILVLLLFLGSTLAYAQKNLVTIKGLSEIIKVDPSVLNHVSLKAKGHDGKEHTYTGVLLSDILSKAGIVLGNKRDGISSYLIIRAKDNYKTLFSLAEIDPLFTKSDIILGNLIDNKPLDASDAPFQVIVPQDKLQTRWIRQVVEIELVKVK